MPNLALPSDFAGTSVRGVGFPTKRKSFGSFNAISSTLIGDNFGSGFHQLPVSGPALGWTVNDSPVFGTAVLWVDTPLLGGAARSISRACAPYLA